MVTVIKIALWYFATGFCYSALYLALDWRADGRDAVLRRLDKYVLLVVGWPLHLLVITLKEVAHVSFSRHRKLRVSSTQRR